MPRVKIEDLPRLQNLNDEQLKSILGGTITLTNSTITGNTAGIAVSGRNDSPAQDINDIYVFQSPINLR